MPQRQVPVAATAAPFVLAKPPPAPVRLQLKAVFLSAKHPTVLINDQTFSVNEEAKVSLGLTNQTIRCLAIRPNSVRIQLCNSKEEQELFLPGK